MSELQINTTQNVKISFNNAAVGQRIGAFLIDSAIKTGYIMLTMISFGAFKGKLTCYVLFFNPRVFFKRTNHW